MRAIDWAGVVVVAVPVISFLLWAWHTFNNEYGFALTLGG